MKKILFFIFAALSLVACEKDEFPMPENNHPGLLMDYFIKYSPKAIILDRAKGGEVVVTGDYASFPTYVIPIKIDDRSMHENVVYFWDDIVKNFPSVKDLRKVKSYQAHGCNIKLSRDFLEYTVKVDKNCEWDYLEVWTHWVNGYPAPSIFYIVLNPDLYDRFRQYN